MSPFDRLLSILAHWQRLPELFGNNWAQTAPRLRLALQRVLDCNGNAPLRERLAAEVILILQENGSVRAYFRRILPAAAPDIRYGAHLADLSHPGAADWADVRAQFESILDSVHPEPAPDRFVNLDILTATGAGIPATFSLGVRTKYYLRISIGDLTRQSIVQRAVPFPARELPSTADGHWLDVVTDSRDLAFPARTFALFLPRQGTGWSCQCARDHPHRCEPRQREAFLKIPFRTGAEAKLAAARVSIYYENNLVQSYQMSLSVTAHEAVGGRLEAVLDYNLVSALQELDRLRPRAWNFLTTIDPARGDCLLHVQGHSASLSFSLTTGQMDSSVHAVRAALRNVHLREEKTLFGGLQRINRVGAQHAKPLPDLIEDLATLAPLGQTLWSLIFQAQDEAWWDALRKPCIVQISRPAGTQIVFPWALLYDIPMEPGAPPRQCRLLREWETAKASLTPETRSCPFEAEHGLNTLCPFGFWGFRHLIEQPPSLPEGRNLPLQVQRLHDRPAIVVGRSLNLNPELAQAHLTTLGPVVDCDSLEKLKNALIGRVEILYFYTHGRRRILPGTEQTTPWLELGKDPFEPEHIVAWRRACWPRDHWKEVSPLVFINGCHTAEVTPETLLSFVETFVHADAGGVIGTEITVEQGLAGEVAAQFLQWFYQQVPAAIAIQRMRLDFLRRGNLLGLAYTPFCSADLTLSDPTLPPPTHNTS